MTTTHAQTTAIDHADAVTDEQMHAITQDRYGSAEVLSLDIVARPEPKADEVLVEVVAAAVDRGTCHLMTGTPYLIRLAGFGLTKPKRKTPGSDVAGRVVAVGSDVTRFAPGDEVFGIASGSLAEFAVANEDNLVIKPAGASFEQAAASAVSGVTALQALVDVGGAEPGQRVLIVGASGGVGSFAVQLAKALGTEVTAVAGTRNIDFVRALGADHVVDYHARDFTEIDEPFDLVLDIGGSPTTSNPEPSRHRSTQPSRWPMRPGRSTNSLRVRRPASPSSSSVTAEMTGSNESNAGDATPSRPDPTRLEPDSRRSNP